MIVGWIYAEIMVLSFKPVLDWTRIWSRNESYQSSCSDPTGQKGEGARVCSSFRKRNASPSRVCYAGIISCHVVDNAFAMLCSNSSKIVA